MEVLLERSLRPKRVFKGDFSPELMKRKEQFVQTRRVERITVTRVGGRSHAGTRCDLCGHNVEWLTLADVSAITGICPEQVQKNVVNGGYHVRVFAPSEPVLVCARSITNNEKTP